MKGLKRAMKKNEWFLIPVWLVALVLVALRMFAPDVLPERVEWLPYLIIAICCGRNLAAAAPAFNPDIPDDEKEELRWNKFWMYWGIAGLALVFLCFVFYMEVSYVLILWLAATIVITAKAFLESRRDAAGL